MFIYKRRLKSHRTKRSSGGILCYIRKSIAPGICLVPDPLHSKNSFNDRLWLKLDRSFFGFNKHLFICLCYISPALSTHTSSRENIWLDLEREIKISYFGEKGNIMLTGDLNARTSTNLLLIMLFTSRCLLIILLYNSEIPRSSQDTV